MIRTILRSLRNNRGPVPLTEQAAAERDKDALGLPEFDPGGERAAKEAISWLCAAQDHSASNDGGVARDFSLLTGWRSSYPETTGYIIPTFIRYSKMTGDPGLLDRARRMLDWLVSIQFPDGGFQGSIIGAEPLVPVTFNTGQILLGLAAGTREFGDEYRESMLMAASWLVSTQDPDGCWRSHRSPFTEPTDKAYETHVSWGLFEASRLVPGAGFENAAFANVRWALGLQEPNGWFRECCLSEPDEPLTHTIGYVLRGIIEAFNFSGKTEYLDAAVKTGDALINALRSDGSLPGRLDRNWSGTVEWSCLTGNVQIANCWMHLYRATGDDRFLIAGKRANQFVRRTIAIDGPVETRGAVKGSFPVNGDYCAYEYPNWAAKFFIDSQMMEMRLEAGGE
jgi:hypothetical protein